MIKISLPAQLVSLLTVRGMVLCKQMEELSWFLNLKKVLLKEVQGFFAK
jgi:hypothetical protein